MDFFTPRGPLPALMYRPDPGRKAYRCRSMETKGGSLMHSLALLASVAASFVALAAQADEHRRPDSFVDRSCIKHTTA